MKIDKKQVKVGDEDVNLMLWDLEGRDGTRDITASYVRGAHGIIYVADGTRKETVDQVGELRTIVEGVVGAIPSVVALNKFDLTAEWNLDAAAETSAGGSGVHRLRTSAKTGEGVEAAFQWLAEATLANPGASA